MSHKRRRAPWLIGALLAARLLAPNPAPAQTPGIDPAARAALPEALRQSGVLAVATALQWPPFDFTGADNKPDGLDIRLVAALAAKLGLTPKFTDVTFTALVPGVSTGRFDIGVDEIADTPERRKVVQLVPYYRAGLGVLVPHDATGIDPNHLCGHMLAVTQGSMQVAVVDRLAKACTDAGDKPIRQIFFPNSADTYLAVGNGRGEAFVTDRAVGLYVAQHHATLAMLPGTLPQTDAVYGLVVGKDNAALAAALRIALKALIQDGTYKTILETYGVPEGAVTSDQVDAPSQK